VLRRNWIVLCSSLKILCIVYFIREGGLSKYYFLERKLDTEWVTYREIIEVKETIGI
jgi:hypothetical protein